MLTVSTYPEGDHFIVMSIDDPKASRRSLQPVVPGAPKTPILYNAVWLPDGKGILFSAATEPVGGGNFNYNIYRQDLVSGRIDQLTDLKGIIDGFSLSPDGGRAAILQRGHYFLLDVTSRQLKQIGEKPE